MEKHRIQITLGAIMVATVFFGASFASWTQIPTDKNHSAVLMALGLISLCTAVGALFGRGPKGAMMGILAVIVLPAVAIILLAAMAFYVVWFT